MRLASLAALVSGGAASVIPAAAVDLLDRRLIQPNATLPTLPPVSLPSLIPFPSPSTCASYVTVTETPALLTLTETRYAIVTSETVTSTQTSLSESTLEATRTATITQFETSFVTETATTATETATREPVKVQKKIVQKRQKKRDSCKRRSSSSQASASQTSSFVDTVSASQTASEDTISASQTSSSIENISVTSSSADVCTATVTAAALKTTTTLTLTDSATATNVETVTSVIVATITTTVSTTDSETTAVPTTLSVTATTFVAPPDPTRAPPAPTFYLRADAASGTVADIYLRITPDLGGTNRVSFVSNDQAGASLFRLQDDGSVVSVLNPDQTLRYFSSSLSAAVFQDGQGPTAAQCQLNGTTTPGSTGSFVCPNGFSGLSAFGDDLYGNDNLLFTQSGLQDERFPPVRLLYVIPGDSTPTTPTANSTVTTPAPPPATPTFAIRAAGGGTYDGQYLKAIGSVEAGSVNNVVFTSDPGSAIAFTLQGATSVVVALHPEHVLSYEPSTASYAYVNEPMDGMAPAACQLTGDTTTVGAVGEFACPNGDSGLAVFSVDHGIDNTLIFDQIGDLVFEPVGLEYVILGNSAATTPVVTTLPPP
ncbi:hypothetical protein PG985_016445 [Apiospora marii]|uniref:uncharacterized protein n=1 Tax=Apiospora marii TaxID=335849 RepID=UPI003130E22C